MGANNGHDLEEQLVRFQETGQGFDALWHRLVPMVESLAVGPLRKHYVLGIRGEVDRTAIDEIRQQVVVKLLELSEPGRSGRFDPAKGVGGIAGVRNWLFPLVSNTVADYCRLWRAGKGKVKLSTMTGLGMNTLDDAGVNSRNPPPKCRSLDLGEILNRCVKRLPETLANPVRLRLAGMTDREVGKNLGCAASTVSKRIARAMPILRKLLEAEGIDDSFLDVLAA